MFTYMLNQYDQCNWRDEKNAFDSPFYMYVCMYVSHETISEEQIGTQS